MACFTYIREQAHLGITQEGAEKLCNMYGLKDPNTQKKLTLNDYINAAQAKHNRF